MIDFHCHVDLYPDPTAVVREIESRGTYVLSVTTTPRAWRGTHRLAQGAARIQTALGLHPQLVPERSIELPLFESLVPEAKYVGEIGLDGSPDYRASLSQQIFVFEAILDIVNRAGGRTMSVHSRSAVSAVLSVLKKFPSAGCFVLHWFTGTHEELKEAIAAGAWFSVGPAMLRSRRGQEIVRALPRDRVVTETDGPFGLMNGRPLVPWDSSLALDSLATLWCLTREEARELVFRNFRMLVR